MRQDTPMSEISAIKTPDYSPEILDSAVSRHMSALGLEPLFTPGKKVLIKPNLLMKAAPEQAIATHPAMLAAVLRWLKTRGINDITIADSPGGPYTKSHLEGIYKACGFDSVAREHGAVLNTSTDWVEIPHNNGRACRHFSIISPVQNADLIINLARLKTHGMMMLSAAVKNLFGCIPGLQKPELHFRFQDKATFAEMLVDLCELVKPTVCIVDAVVSMEGDGPSGGTPRETGMTLASLNPHSLDLALCDFIAMPPEHVYTVNAAINRGLCPASAAELDYLNDGRPAQIEGFIFPNSKPLGFYGHVPAIFRGPVKFLSEVAFAPVPVIRKGKCVGCGKCAESCAPKAAVILDRKAVIDYSKCIKCFCCHEFCAFKAIDIKRFRFKR